MTEAEKIQEIDDQVFRDLFEPLSVERRRMLFETILRDVQNLSAAFFSARENADADAAQRAAHSLIGVAGAIGADRLVRLARTATVPAGAVIASCEATSRAAHHLFDRLPQQVQ